MGYLAMGVRAFASAGVSNRLLFAAAGFVLMGPVVYFVWRLLGQAAANKRIFEVAPAETWFGRDRRKRALSGRQKAAISIERRRKQRSMPISSRL